MFRRTKSWDLPMVKRNSLQVMLLLLFSHAIFVSLLNESVCGCNHGFTILERSSCDSSFLVFRNSIVKRLRSRRVVCVDSQATLGILRVRACKTTLPFLPDIPQTHILFLPHANPSPHMANNNFSLADFE